MLVDILIDLIEEKLFAVLTRAQGLSSASSNMKLVAPGAWKMRDQATTWIINLPVCYLVGWTSLPSKTKTAR